jgi:hypothetical protein
VVLGFFVVFMMAWLTQSALFLSHAAAAASILLMAGVLLKKVVRRQAVSPLESLGERGLNIEKREAA